jgi:SAM-dependent methyltransferase
LGGYKIKPTSIGKWNKAQDAETNWYHLPENRVEVKPNKYLHETFLLEEDFFHEKVVLEIGCTSFGIIHNIEKTNMKIGIDPLAQFFGATYPQGTEHAQCRGEELPFKDECFDVIICLNTLDHTQDPQKVLIEIKRCLKKGGTLLFSLETYQIFNTLRKMLHTVDAPHPHHFSDAEFRKLCEELGFDMELHDYKKMKSILEDVRWNLRSGKKSSAMKLLVANVVLGAREVRYKYTINSERT